LNLCEWLIGEWLYPPGGLAPGIQHDLLPRRDTHDTPFDAAHFLWIICACQRDAGKFYDWSATTVLRPAATGQTAEDREQNNPGA